MELKSLRKAMGWLLVLTVLMCGGCGVSKEITNLAPDRGQTPLQQLESHLDYVDPDAGQPNYRRDD
ncbi:MAG: hypothetical protein GY809_10350 [Planctomycetes bacterium]|nr:hypothetical protein [Planctomycetota bacterium]